MTAVMVIAALLGPVSPAGAVELPTITDRFLVGTFPNSLAISQDGARIVTTNSPYSAPYGSTASVITRATRNVSSVTVGSRPQGVAITPDGTQAYVANYDGTTTSVITLATVTVFRTLGGLNRPGRPAITGDGTTALVPSGGLGARVVAKFSVASGAGAGNLTGTQPDCLTPNNDATMFFTCLSTTSSIGLFAPSDASISNIPVGDFNCSNAAFAPDGGTLYASCTGTSPYRIAQVNATTRTLTRTITVASEPGRLAVNPAGTRVFVVRPGGSAVAVIQAGGNVLANTPVTGTPRYVGVSNDGAYVLVATDEGNLIVLDSTGTQVLTTLALGGTPTSLAVARSGDFAAIALSSTNEVVTIGLPRSESGGSPPTLPTAPLQQYVPAPGEVCGTNPPPSVDFPGLVGLRNQGWVTSQAQWPNGGRGGTADRCSSREVRWESSTVPVPLPVR
ncbi:MAG: YncE family protein [Actinomycetales bacterium]